MKKLLWGLLALLLVSGIGGLIFLYSFPDLSEETEEMIQTALAEENLPSYHFGKEYYADNEGVTLWYEVIGDTARPTVMLIMGHSASAMFWQPYFVRPLLEAGFSVIRCDNRGLGKSDWIDDWTQETAYSQTDMAADAMAILDDAGIEQVHLVGFSMGGMISQRMTIDHPNRILSLTSISSSAFSGDPDLPGMSSGFLADYARLAYHFGDLDTEEKVVKASLAVQLALSGDHRLHLDKSQFIRQILFELRERKGINPMVSAQHDATETDRPNHYEALATSTVPSLVIHGTIDPVISVEHAKKYTTLVPNAESLLVDGMGHNLPIDKMEIILPVLIRHFNQHNVQ